MNAEAVRPQRITTAMQLKSLRTAGVGYVINEHHPKADGTRKKPTLHGVLCTTLEAVEPDFKLFSADAGLAQTWLNLTKGLEGRNWTRCRLCGGVNPGEVVRSTATIRTSPQQSANANRETDTATGGSTVRQLWCDAGGHFWFRPPIRGTRPKACPVHAATRDVPHPSTDPALFQLESGWSIRLSTSPRLRKADEIELPETLAAAMGLVPQQLTDVRPGATSGPKLTLWRGRRGASCRGPIGDLIPASAKPTDRLFLAFAPPQYEAQFVAIAPDSKPLQRLAGLVGLPIAAVESATVWHSVSRRLGVSVFDAKGLAHVAARRGDPELASAIEAASRLVRTTNGWPGWWDLTAPLHPDPRFMALTDGRRTRVAVGVADPRDRLPERFLVSPGGLVWIEVEHPEAAKAEASTLAADVLAPGHSERWVRLMRAEHGARRASIAGQRWRLEIDGPQGARPEANGSDLPARLASLVADPDVEVGEGQHILHRIPRSALAVERALRLAQASGLSALEADPRAGFAAKWGSGTIVSSSILGALTPGG